VIRVLPAVRIHYVGELLVGVERAPTLEAPRAVIAHAVPDLGKATSAGVALCGLPVEVLTLVPELRWADPGVPRCADCAHQVEAVERLSI
jgi:hypothetical protein